jgi:hypothetical protein
LRAERPQLADERRRVGDTERIGLIHHDLNVGVLRGSAQPLDWAIP